MPTLSILITQCLQHDFVAPLGPHEPLPNALHVGHQEATRLLGATPSSGPLAQLMQWTRAQDELVVLHIRDWHDPEDPAQRAHLERFGPHCLQDTLGARLVLGLDEEVTQRDAEQFIDSTTLNDFMGTELAAQLDACLERVGHDASQVRVGVIGVWTEAKVSFLCYELATRYGIDALATCSALTASASRTQHFNALSQLSKILGVQVFDSVGDFAEWLAPGAHGLRAVHPEQRMRPEFSGDVEELTEAQLNVMAYLYRDAARLELDVLGGGFSGALVCRVRAWDAPGHELSSTVLKLGDRTLIGAERRAFEQVEAILGNDAPSVLGFADFGECAGIKYAYAAMGQGEVRTFKQLYESGLEQARVDAILDDTFARILGRFYAVSHYERLPLFEYYTFSSRYAGGVRERIAGLVGEEMAGQATLYVEGIKAMNVADFYEHELDGLMRRGHAGEFHHVAYVHGDLNGANILLDGRDNVWLIDFFHAHRGHIVRDVAKFENDLLYIFTPISGAAEFAQAMRISVALCAVQDLRAPLGACPEGVVAPPLTRAWNTLCTLRRHVARLCQSERAPEHLHVALLRYAVHTLSFDESSEWQRKWALVSAGLHAQKLVAAARANTDLRVGWVEMPGDGASQRLGVTICPGRTDRERVLAQDVSVLAEHGTTMVMGHLTDAEMTWADVEALPVRCEASGMAYLHHPVLDQGVPIIEEMAVWVDAINEELERGSAIVVVHCMGGLGRSGTTVACVLVSHGLSPEEAIDRVRVARGPRAVETRVQEEFVAEFANFLAVHAQSCNVLDA